MTDFAELRRNMVDCQLRPNNITDLDILAAMDTVPREKFVPSGLQAIAYLEQSLALTDDDHAMLTPIALATLIQAADIKPTDYVLDIGCLTGYSSAVLSHLADSVVALEENSALAAQASEILNDLEVGNVAVVESALLSGQAEQGPFDVILINGAVDEVPQDLLAQLKDGGRLVTIVIENGYGRAMRYIKTGGVVGAAAICDLSGPRLTHFQKDTEFVL